MAKRPDLTDLTSLTNSSAINTLSQNWDAIQEAFDNTLSLDGSTPNAMEADLDLNGNALLNVGTIDVSNLTLDGQTVTDLATVPEWRSSWLTATSYAVNDLVKTAGNVYICLVAHTSGTFATDLTALKWELMVSKGDSGAGTGDMVAANNLSDLADDATARANLGLGTVAVESTVPVAKGGTGATDAATARTNLGLGALSTAASVTTSEIAAATLVTAADTIASNDNDTTIPTSAAVVDYVQDNLSAGWTLVETISCTSGSTKETSSFEAGKDYLFVFVGVSGASGSPTIDVSFFGETAAAYTTQRNFTDGISSANFAFGEYIYRSPKVSRKVHNLTGMVQASATSSGSDQTYEIVPGRQGAGVNYATAQGVSKVRFALSGGIAFDAGSILVYKK